MAAPSLMIAARSRGLNAPFIRRRLGRIPNAQLSCILLHDDGGGGRAPAMPTNGFLLADPHIAHRSFSARHLRTLAAGRAAESYPGYRPRTEGKERSRPKTRMVPLSAAAAAAADLVGATLCRFDRGDEASDPAPPPVPATVIVEGTQNDTINNHTNINIINREATVPRTSTVYRKKNCARCESEREGC
jgi:hypothetical protein